MTRSKSVAGVVARLMSVLLLTAVAGWSIGAAVATARTSSHHARGHQRSCRKHRRCHRHARKHKPTKGTTKYPGTKPAATPNAHGGPVAPIKGVPGLNTNQSNNWFGYNQGTLEQGGNKLFSSIGGSWTVPTATQHTAGQAENSSDWIGIGGGCVDANCTLTDSTLIQTGTEQDVDASGAASYSAWWEIIPGPSLSITTMTIHPGDRMSASIAQVVPGLWKITVSDTTDGQSYTTTVPYTSTETTAEWIEETPLLLSTNAGFAALPNLTSPNFDLATTNGSNANLQPSEEMDLIDANGSVIGAPSAPDPDTDGFNACTWSGTCTAPTSS